MKQKKVKEYVGEIPFDVWGNQLQYISSWGSAGSHDICEDNFVNGKVCIKQRWNDQSPTELFFQDSIELKYQKFSEPRHKQSDYNKTGPLCVIGSITDVVKQQNHVFSDTLEYVTYEKGRSAINFIFSRADGRKVSMFSTDFDVAIKKMVNGKLTGNFTFCKRGANYGCKLVG